MLKFLVFGDLHYDDLDDSDNRIAELLDKAKAEQVDFMVCQWNQEQVLIS